jgi:transglutaminase-like putative cysteine protease
MKFVRFAARTRALRGALLIAAVGLSTAVPADAYDPVLHEFIPPDDGEDLAMSVKTAEGDLPAAIDTPSGVVRAPDTRRLPVRGESAYRDGQGASAPSVFRPDRDTRRPNMVHYDDPFSPSVAPYKRLRAYDSVGLDYGLRVRDTSLIRVPIGGEARVGEEEFYGDMAVDFEASASVLIPSVGPGTRILRLHTTPPTPIEVWRDGADNWFAKTSGARTRVRLVMQLAIARAAFGGDFTMASWQNLRPVSPLPPMAARAVPKVEAALGLSRQVSPADTVRRLVSYFRGFVPSEDPPSGHRDIYLDLALSQKGVCRHRAFAFLVTALGLGIPARVVTNEAHAWVEVEADGIWRRIDLGGAAGAIDEGSAEDRPLHRPPADNFPWPATDASSGSQATARGRQGSSGGSSSQSSSASDGSGRGSSSSASAPSRVDGARGGDGDARARESSAVDPAVSGDPAQDRREDDRPRPKIVVSGADVSARHGGEVRVTGRVEIDGAGCGDLRIDVVLRRLDTGGKTAIGALTTDSRGMFDGNIVVPMNLAVGEYGVTVSTPGDARCGPATSITR